ncbi:MAG: DUF4445 domain-containing protein, partial [Deltaproteobacteria bacterium]|nr:DUF4445 domain-containing protein [Deltaproteobacteria bacterium]
PFEKTIDIDGSRNLLELAREAGIPLQSTCGGKKICGKCKVVIKKTDGPLPPSSAREQKVLGGYSEKGYRLACETVLTHGAVVVIPDESRIKRQVILTWDTKHSFPVRLRPNVSPHYVEVSPPVLDSVIADRERLLIALEKTYGIRRPALDPFVLRKLPHTLRSDREGVTVAIRSKDEIIDLYPGRRDSLFGVAFDVGTTTVVAFLMDLITGDRLSVKSAMNPQIAIGDDVITRIAFCPMAPYPPVLQESQDYKARDLGLNIGASAYVHLLPLKAGFVGSDIIACILATGLHRSKIPTLLIDLGTNGEIVFGNKNRMLCCSTAAGPAFEGGHIRWGMRASSGAIERLKIDQETLDVRWETIYDQRPSGLCGSGIISAIAEMIRAGIILGRGNFDKGLQTPRLRDGEDGPEFVLVRASEAATKQDIVITQKDVAAMQMAKAAVNAGATLLMEQFEGEEVERILLAGAFGNYVDPEDACTIDLFPGCLTAKVVGVGNAAGHGSCLALLDKNKRKEAERIAQKIEYRELAATTRFQDLFVSGMFFKSARDFEDVF